jgi:hypothetical protein
VSILWIGDPHSKPGVSNRRFTWLGKLIDDLRPKTVCQVGDLYDMESLSSYDKGKRSFEGRRYNKDINAGNEALDLIHRQIKGLRNRPRLVALIGNHEERIERAVEETPELEGTISYSDFEYQRFGWEVVPFLEPIVLHGYTAQHYFGSGIMQRPISGENHARRLLQTQYTSCVQGHSHLFDYAERTNGRGQKMQAFVLGCFLDPTQREGYAKRANEMWFKGVLWCPDAENGYSHDFKRIGVNTLLKEYGSH